jgi:hypothetical protein
MANFKDRLDRGWTLELTVLELKKLKSEFQLDLAEFASRENTVFERLASDPVLLVDVLSCLLEEQIRQVGLSEKQFAQGIAGVGIVNATNALIEAVVNFSRPQEGQIIQAMWAKFQATRELATERVLDRMETLDLERLVGQKLDPILASLPQKSGG